jgi:hypothetical protein
MTTAQPTHVHHQVITHVCITHRNELCVKVMTAVKYACSTYGPIMHISYTSVPSTAASFSQLARRRLHWTSLAITPPLPGLHAGGHSEAHADTHSHAHTHTLTHTHTTCRCMEHGTHTYTHNMQMYGAWYWCVKTACLTLIGGEEAQQQRIVITQ